MSCHSHRFAQVLASRGVVNGVHPSLPASSLRMIKPLPTSDAAVAQVGADTRRLSIEKGVVPTEGVEDAKKSG